MLGQEQGTSGDCKTMTSKWLGRILHTQTGCGHVVHIGIGRHDKLQHISINILKIDVMKSMFREALYSTVLVLHMYLLI